MKRERSTGQSGNKESQKVYQKDSSGWVIWNPTNQFADILKKRQQLHFLGMRFTLPPKHDEIKETPDIDKYKNKEKKQEPLIRTKDKIQLKFKVPKGKIANIMGVMNLLQSKFESLEIELIANEGTISEQDYEDKIREAFRQLGIELDEN